MHQAAQLASEAASPLEPGPEAGQRAQRLETEIEELEARLEQARLEQARLEQQKQDELWAVEEDEKAALAEAAAAARAALQVPEDCPDCERTGGKLQRLWQCNRCNGSGIAEQSSYISFRGYLESGDNTLDTATMTLDEARLRCNDQATCVGFICEGPPDQTSSTKIYFKSAWGNKRNFDKKWTSFRKVEVPGDCGPPCPDCDGTGGEFQRLWQCNRCDGSGGQAGMAGFSLRFLNLRFVDVDQAKFKRELSSAYVKGGLSQDSVKKMRMVLREDSLIVEVRAPEAVVQAAANVPVEQLEIMGERPEFQEWPTDPWGLDFMQVLFCRKEDQSLGISSFHFDSINDSYISFANMGWMWQHAHVTPIKMTFSNPTYTKRTRTFTAEIDWCEQDPEHLMCHQTSQQPVRSMSAQTAPQEGPLQLQRSRSAPPMTCTKPKWNYEIVFSEDFSCIERGHIDHGAEDSECGFEFPALKFGNEEDAKAAFGDPASSEMILLYKQYEVEDHPSMPCARHLELFNAYMLAHGELEEEGFAQIVAFRAADLLKVNVCVGMQMVHMGAGMPYGICPFFATDLKLLLCKAIQDFKEPHFGPLARLLFEIIDTDQSKTISRDEFKRAIQVVESRDLSAMGDFFYTMMDKNNDGDISLAEAKDQLQKLTQVGSTMCCKFLDLLLSIVKMPDFKLVSERRMEYIIKYHRTPAKKRSSHDIQLDLESRRHATAAIVATPRSGPLTKTEFISLLVRNGGKIRQKVQGTSMAMNVLKLVRNSVRDFPNAFQDGSLMSITQLGKMFFSSRGNLENATVDEANFVALVLPKLREYRNQMLSSYGNDPMKVLRSYQQHKEDKEIAPKMRKALDKMSGTDAYEKAMKRAHARMDNKLSEIVSAVFHLMDLDSNDSLSLKELKAQKEVLDALVELCDDKKYDPCMGRSVTMTEARDYHKKQQTRRSFTAHWDSLDLASRAERLSSGSFVSQTPPPQLRNYKGIARTFANLCQKLQDEGVAPEEILKIWSACPESDTDPTTQNKFPERRVDPGLQGIVVSKKEMLRMYTEQGTEKSEAYWDGLTVAEGDPESLEFAALAGRFAHKLFTAVDTNGDGEMSVAEIVSYGKKYLVFVLETCKFYTGMYLECWLHEMGTALVENGFEETGIKEEATLTKAEFMETFRIGSLLCFLSGHSDEDHDHAEHVHAAPAAQEAAPPDARSSETLDPGPSTSSSTRF